jgi:NAD(P)-dependent dehydrogenase (short-subunit alcohol dehydrogenase family)
MTASAGGALVTGAGRGLGRGIAHLLAARGHTVHVTDVDLALAERTAADIGGGAFASVLDVRDEVACQAAAAATVARAGSLAVWVNNAGVLITGPAWEQPAATRRTMLEVNALGTMNGTLAAVEVMRAGGGGHVVNVVSLAGIVAPPGETVYAASKHAALAFSLGTLFDLRAAGVGDVAISCLCPDGIWTPMLHDKLGDPTAAMSFSGALLSVEEVVDAVAALLDRPRPIVTLPRSRGLQSRLFATFPRLAVRSAPLVLADARRRQRRHARRLARGRSRRGG